MSKKLFKILFWTMSLLIITAVIGFFFLFRGNLSAFGQFYVNASEDNVLRKGNEEYAKEFKEAKKKLKFSKLNTKTNPIASKSLDVRDSEIYQQARGYIDNIESIADKIKIAQALYAMLGAANPDAVMDTMPYLMDDYYPKLVAMPKEAFYAIMDAMYDPKISWETKYWLCRAIGYRGDTEALSMFRDMADDENQLFWLRMVSMDQIRKFKDKDSNDIVLNLLSHENRELRYKASEVIRDTGEGNEYVNEYVFEKVIDSYYAEEDPEIKDCLLGSAILIGKENSFYVIEKVLDAASMDEKETVAILLRDVPSQNSFNILRSMYSLENEALSNLVLGSLAELKMPEANEFLCSIIEEANGRNSVMAAEYLKDKGQKDAIPYIETALEKERKKMSKFSKDYEEILVQLNQ
ncbi:MAG: HEAT repeat domain-containing protein [bacterium]